LPSRGIPEMSSIMGIKGSADNLLRQLGRQAYLNLSVTRFCIMKAGIPAGSGRHVYQAKIHDNIRR